MICIYQLNCGKRASSISSMVGILSNLATLPACLALQECPTDLSELAGKYLCYRADHGNAAVLVRQDISSISLVRDKYLVAVSLGECVVISMYMHPTNVVQRAHVKAILENLTSDCRTPCLLCADVNAWSILWGSRMSSTNCKNQAWVRGSEVSGTLENMSFQVINDPESPPTFRGGRGCSRIDCCNH